MADELIKVVNQSPPVQDVLKKSAKDDRRKRPDKKKQSRKKDPKRIIDTYV